MTRVYIAVGLRREVSARAGGRCEYCLTPESVSLLSFEPDHIVAQKHGGATEANNLALCCPLCNKHKGTDLASVDPETGVIVLLYNPRRDLWRDHFRWVSHRLEGTTPTGRATVRLLQLNRPERLEERALLEKAGLLPYEPE